MPLGLDKGTLMALDTEIVNSATGLEVSSGHAKVQLASAATPAMVGAVRIFSENDSGDATGTAYLASPETDQDARLRVSQDVCLESDNFYAAAQNTGKYRAGNATLTHSSTATGQVLNAGSSTAVGGAEFRSYAHFPFYGSGFTYVELIVALSNQPVTNSIFEAGAFIGNGSGSAAPSDGVFARHTSSGWLGVASFNGTETIVPFPASAYANNQSLKLQIVGNNRHCDFWIDGVYMGFVESSSTSTATLFSSAALPWCAQYRQPGVAGGVMQARLCNIVVAVGGILPTVDFDDVGNLMHGSYQGTTGNTMGTIVNYANSANPTAAVPTNTTAALGTGLGGQFWETDTLAANTDGIIDSFQVPAHSIAAPGRRYVLKAVTIDSYIQTALTGGGYNAQWTLAFGHTAASLATAEGATAKAPRRVVLGAQSVAAGAAALTQLSRVTQTFTRPVVVNPGEFVAVVKKKVGAAPSAGVVAHLIHFDYGLV
jgi:hypothetical protein